MRPIDEAVVHCAAVPRDRGTPLSEIRAWHKARGWGVTFAGKRYHEGYHEYHRVDGTIEYGRPLGCIGAHVSGRNRRTIGICYEGGVAADGRTALDTRTDAQKASLRESLEKHTARFGLKRITGHRDYAAKACPSFDATAEYAPLLDQAGIFDRVPAADDGILERGEQSAAVLEWTRKLVRAGHVIEATDTFDQRVEMVTRWFQAKRGLVIDGKVGPQTETEMDAILADEAAPPEPAIENDPPEAALRKALAGLDGAVARVRDAAGIRP